MRLPFIVRRVLPAHPGALLVVVLLALLLPARAQGTSQVVLTPSEKAYLDAHNPVTFCADPDWWPFEVIDNQGRHAGIAADLLRRVASRVGLELQVLETPGWEASLQASREGRCTFLSFLNSTPEREKWLTFTEPLLNDPNVLITRADRPYISDLQAYGKGTVALPRGTAMMERLSRDFPNLQIVGTDTEHEALGLVSDGKVDMTLRSLIVAAYTIKSEGRFNLRISGQVPGYDNRLRVGVLRSEFTLRDILNKGIATLTPEERWEVVDSHVSLELVTDVRPDYSLMIAALAVLMLGGLGGVWWWLRMRRENRVLKSLSRTDPLTGLANRAGLMAVVEADLERARRFGRPLSIVMLDLDHFKRVNDAHGHLVGDQVLIQFAGLLRDEARQVDTVCRWGGEEFLLLCNETTATQAQALAKRILQRVRQHPFPERCA